MSRGSTINSPDARIQALESRIRKLETAAQINNATVSRGALRIKSVEGLIVQGSASITGVLNGSGTLTWTGPANLNGNTFIGGTLHVTSTATLGGNTTINGVLVVNAETQLDGDTTISGALDVTGNATISGTLDITGDVTVTGDLNVTGGGQINAGAVTITPASGGQVKVGPVTIQGNGHLNSSDGYLRVLTSLDVLGVIGNTGMGSRSTASTANPVYIDDFGTLFRFTG